MKNNKTPRQFVLEELLNGRRVTQEFVLRRTNYWRLATIIDALQRRYKIHISRQDVVAKHAQYQTAYWLDDEARRKIFEAKKGREAREK